MAYKNHIAKYNNSQAIQDAVNNGNLLKPYVALAGNALDFNTKVVFDVDAQDMEFPASGGTSAITITASQDWTITLPAWLSASTLSGNSSQVVTITAQATQQANEGTIRITNGAKTFTVNAEQAEPAIDYSAMYFTIEALESGEFLNQSNSFSYSVNGGEWTATDWETPIQVQTGDKIRFKSQSDEIMHCGDGVVNYDFIVYGNIMSLMYGDNFTGQTENTVNLSDMFAYNEKLISAEHLILPATTLYGYAYSTMFGGCVSLTTPPVLPATTLGEYCYQNMFQGCSGLTTFPALPATTLAEGCYFGMFYGCTSLTQAPELPATTMANSCYGYMFYGCTSLTQAPELPATTMASSCYSQMFQDCTSLTQAPALPATTMMSNCYWSMFSNCTSLTQAPALPATTLATNCYAQMFLGCTSLTAAPELPATTMATNCYAQMFYNCSSLSSITCLATNPDTGCTGNWTESVASTGTFYKSPSATGWTTGASGIPSGWTVEDYSA